MRSVLVSGAGAGIGRAVAERFLAGGWRVGAFDIDAAALTDLRAAHTDAALVTGHLDVRDPTGWESVLATFCGDGGLNALVNNAGVLRSGEFAELPLDAQLAIVDVNVKGVVTGCHTAYPYLRRADRPRVINLASASAIYGQRELAVYSASKFAVRGLTEALDLEWAGAGIRVVAVWPLFVRTAMTADMDIGTTRALGIRLGPDDVAAEVWAVANDDGRRAGFGSVHRSVGRTTRVAMAGAAVSPSWLLRAANRFLGSR